MLISLVSLMLLLWFLAKLNVPSSVELPLQEKNPYTTVETL